MNIFKRIVKGVSNFFKKITQSEKRTKRKLNKSAITLSDEMKKAQNKLATAKNTLQKARFNIKKHRDLVYEKQREFDDAKKAYYRTEDLKTIIDKGYATLQAGGAYNEDELKAMDRLRNKLGNYELGDRTITTYYHEYGFQTITDESLYAFVKGEGLA